MPKKIFTQELEGTRKRGRPMKGWKEEVERDLQVLGMKRWRQLVADRKKWKDIARQAKAHSGLQCQWKKKKKKLIMRGALPPLHHTTFKRKTNMPVASFVLGSQYMFQFSFGTQTNRKILVLQNEVSPEICVLLGYRAAYSGNAADLRLRPHCHRDRLFGIQLLKIIVYMDGLVLINATCPLVLKRKINNYFPKQLCIYIYIYIYVCVCVCVCVCIYIYTRVLAQLVKKVPALKAIDRSGYRILLRVR